MRGHLKAYLFAPKSINSITQLQSTDNRVKPGLVVGDARVHVRVMSFSAVVSPGEGTNDELARDQSTSSSSGVAETAAHILRVVQADDALSNPITVLGCMTSLALFVGQSSLGDVLHLGL